MRIPTKIQHGDKVISTVYAKINGIIDYLNASRVKPGTGIRVQETPSGTVVFSVPNSVTPPQLNAGGSGATGIESDVTGGTASIMLTGGTGSVNFVGTGSVVISGNTNTGNIEINATGGTSGVIGFPNYALPLEYRNVAMNTNYSYNVPVWVIGEVHSVILENELRGDLFVDITAGTHTTRIYLFDVYDSTLATERAASPITLPIPANYTFRFGSVTDDPDLDVSIFPCV